MSGRIAGVIVDEAGQPAIGARVSIAEAAQAGRSIVFNAWAGATDALGRFEANGLRAAEYDVTAAWSRGTRGATERVRTGDLEVRIVLASGATIAGRVLLDGEPMPYFGVLLSTPNVFGGEPVEVRASDGRFALPHVSPGTWSLSLLGPGTWRKVIEEVTVGDQPLVDLGDIKMGRALRVAGHVRDRNGAPVAHARVLVGRWRGEPADHTQLESWFYGDYEATTDRDGAYVFDGIDANQDPSRSPQIWAEHGEAGVSILRELGPTETEVDFTLLGVGRIEGFVIGQLGGHAAVTATRPDEPPHARFAMVRGAGFRFDYMPPGDFVVRIESRDVDVAAPVTVTVVANGTARPTLEVTTPTVELTVRVPTGQAKELVIEPTSEGAGVGGRWNMISQHGTHDECHLYLVRPGSYRLSIDRTTWMSVTISDVLPEQTIDLLSGGLKPEARGPQDP